MLSRLALLLLERKRRQAQAQAISPEALAWTEKMQSVAARLRAHLHPKQAAFWRMRPAKVPIEELRRAAKTTRRSGKTAGGTYEVLSRCISIPGYRAVYSNTTLAEARKLVWRSDTRDGWLDIISRLPELRMAHKRAEMDAGKADCFVDDKLHTIEFKNGSQIALFCADDASAIEKIRGQAKHLIWIDEAQKFSHLQTFIEDILEGNLTMNDYAGELLLTGTPSKNAGTYYYEITKEPEQGERIPGWEIHEWSLLDNPYFGATEAERFVSQLLPRIQRAQPRTSDLTPEQWVTKFCENPPAWFVREYQGKWTLTDAFFVYPIHQVLPEERCYAPIRVNHIRPRSPEGNEIESLDMTGGWLDVDAAMADLPPHWEDHRGKKHKIRWLTASAFDFGFSPDPFAMTVFAWSLDIADLYELWSWKQVEVHPDDARDIVRWTIDNIPNMTVCVGDAGGLQKGHMVGWRDRLGVQIEDAQKAAKRTWIALMGGEITRGYFHYRDNSPLLDEHLYLTWKVDRDGKLFLPNTENADRTVGSDKRVPGNHCSDCNLYSYRHVIARRMHFFGRNPIDPNELLRRDESAMEQWADGQTTLALREQGGDDYNPDSY